MHRFNLLNIFINIFIKVLIVLPSNYKKLIMPIMLHDIFKEDIKAHAKLSGDCLFSTCMKNFLLFIICLFIYLDNNLFILEKI